MITFFFDKKDNLHKNINNHIFLINYINNHIFLINYINNNFFSLESSTLMSRQASVNKLRIIFTKPNLFSSMYALQYVVYTGYHALSTKSNLFSFMYALQYVVYTGYHALSTKANLFSPLYAL